MGATGLEPVTPSLSSKNISNLSGANKELAASRDSGCTGGCTSEAKTQETDQVGALAAALLSLSSSDRARLAALLTGQAEGENRRGESQ
jgi:hypothetical protein